MSLCRGLVISFEFLNLKRRGNPFLNARRYRRLDQFITLCLSHKFRGFNEYREGGGVG